MSRPAPPRFLPAVLAALAAVGATAFANDGEGTDPPPRDYGYGSMLSGRDGIWLAHDPAAETFELRRGLTWPELLGWLSLRERREFAGRIEAVVTETAPPAGDDYAVRKMGRTLAGLLRGGIDPEWNLLAGPLSARGRLCPLDVLKRYDLTVDAGVGRFRLFAHQQSGGTYWYAWRVSDPPFLQAGEADRVFRAAALRDVKESGEMPPGYVLDYFTGVLGVEAARDRAVRTWAGRPEWAVPPNELLVTPITVSFDGATLEEAIRTAAAAAGTVVAFDRAAAEEAGVDLAAPVAASFEDERLFDVLRALFPKRPDGAPKLAMDAHTYGTLGITNPPDPAGGEPWWARDRAARAAKRADETFFDPRPFWGTSRIPIALPDEGRLALARLLERELPRLGEAAVTDDGLAVTCPKRWHVLADGAARAFAAAPDGERERAFRGFLDRMRAELGGLPEGDGFGTD